MTRAPRSASWRVANGAATACSIETTVIPASGGAITSVRPWQAQYVLSHVGQNHVRRDRGHLIELRLAKLALDVVVLREPKSAMRLHCDIGRLPRRISGQKLGHICLRATRFPAIEQLSGANTHEIGGFDVHMRACDRKLDALVLANRPAEHHPLLRVLRRPID